MTHALRTPQWVPSVPNSTSVSIGDCHDTAVREDPMSKSGVVGSARRRHGRRQVAVRNAVEGQMVEMCRDIAVQAKRMRQLQQQADELCMVIREWVSQSEPYSDPESTNRGGRRSSATY